MYRVVWFCYALFLLQFSRVDAAGAILKNVQADQIDYDTRKIRLAGAVWILHEFGEIRCEKGVLLFEETQTAKLAPRRILLEGSVQVTLQDGSTISSDEADIDCASLEAVFVSKSPAKVVYITRVVDDKVSVPVKATSQALRVLMKKSEGSKSEYVLADLQGEGAVRVEYQHVESEKE